MKYSRCWNCRTIITSKECPKCKHQTAQRVLNYEPENWKKRKEIRREEEKKSKIQDGTVHRQNRGNNHLLNVPSILLVMDVRFIT